MLKKEHTNKIYKELSKLSKTLEGLRDKKIVYTGGVFDLFHYGHLNYLERTASMGDILVVHVNGDEYTRSKKRFGAPIVSEDKRALIIASLDFVDYVVIWNKPSFDDELIKVIKPNLFVRVIKPEVSEQERGERIKVSNEKFPWMEVKFIPPTNVLDHYDVVSSKETKTERRFKDADLVRIAYEVSTFGYSYSGFKVGASLADNRGYVYTGAGLNHASPSLSVCAERIAIENAVGGGSSSVRVLALVTTSEGIPTPCGACRQLIYEFSDPLYPTKIILANAKGDIVTTDINALFPMPYERV